MFALKIPNSTICCISKISIFIKGLVVHLIENMLND